MTELFFRISRGDRSSVSRPVDGVRISRGYSLFLSIQYEILQGLEIEFARISVIQSTTFHFANVPSHFHTEGVAFGSGRGKLYDVIAFVQLTGQVTEVMSKLYRRLLVNVSFVDNRIRVII